MENYFESGFPSDYRKEDIEKVLHFLLSGKFCQLISLPGGGKATLLRLLAFNQSVLELHLREKAKDFLFVYLNLLELPSFEQTTIDKFILLALNEQSESNDSVTLSQKLKDALIKQTNEQKTVIFLFDHFDEVQNKLPNSFFQSLRSLRSLAKYRFSAVFATRRDLQELVDTELLKEFYDFFVDNAVYMKLLDKNAMDFMFSQIEKATGKTFAQETKDKLVNLTGGHTKLLKVSAENTLPDEPLDPKTILSKRIIQAAFFELWFFLTPEEQQILIDISKNQQTEQTSALENLIQLELLNDKNNFTIPLLEEFIKEQSVIEQSKNETITFDSTRNEILKGTIVISELLSPLEFKLLKFLIANSDRIIERDEIINSVWHEDKSTQGVTDQALDQIIYRLRKKIEENPNDPKHLLTIKGRGIKFQP